ncbi:MAG: lanthionine synthetase LanC family protein [Planctomycetales bacterium]
MQASERAGYWEEPTATTATCSIRPTRHHAKTGPKYACCVFSGALGIAVAAIHAGIALQAEPLIETGLAILEESARWSGDDREIDVIGGSAGAIPLLIGIGRRFESQSLLDLAAQHGDELLERSSRQQAPAASSEAAAGEVEGWERCWKSPAFGSAGMTGYSHGAAGFVNALLEVHRLTGKAPYLEAAGEALVFERRWFDASQQNWLDLRSAAEGTPPMAACAWCHGAPGIGLARLRTLELLPDDRSIVEEIQSALMTTTRFLKSRLEPGNNFSLCHGLLGNSELPIAMNAREMSASEGLKAAGEVIQLGLEKYAFSHSPWKCGTNDGRSAPGLMLGTAGIGYALLRHRGPSATPSLLLLTPSLFESSNV